MKVYAEPPPEVGTHCENEDLELQAKDPGWQGPLMGV